MRAIVDQGTCIGCGLCPQICPDVFEMGDDNLAKVRVDPVPVGVGDACREAAQSCPTSAILIQE